MRKILTLVLASALALPVLVFAQPGPPGEPGGGTQGRHGTPWLDPGFVARVLDMTEEQVADMRVILEETHEAVEPLRLQIDELGDELRELLEGSDPDPADVGSLTIEIHELRGEIQGLRDAAVDAIGPWRCASACTMAR